MSAILSKGVEFLPLASLSHIPQMRYLHNNSTYQSIQKQAPSKYEDACFWKEKSQHLPIFPGRLQPSIFGTTQLNFRVRDGNGWILSVIGTGFSLYMLSCFRRLTTLSWIRMRLQNWTDSNTSASCWIRFFRFSSLRSSPRPISTPKLNASLHLHLVPIAL